MFTPHVCELSGEGFDCPACEVVRDQREAEIVATWSKAAPDWLDEIEAQADASVPYYVPRLIAEIRRLRARECR